MIEILKGIDKAFDIIAEMIVDKIFEILGVETRVLCPVRVEADYYDED